MEPGSGGARPGAAPILDKATLSATAPAHRSRTNCRGAARRGSLALSDRAQAAAVLGLATRILTMANVSVGWRARVPVSVLLSARSLRTDSDSRRSRYYHY